MNTEQKNPETPETPSTQEGATFYAEPKAENEQVSETTEEVEEKPLMSEAEKKAYAKRVKKAFESLDTRGLVHRINHLFPEVRTAVVAKRIVDLQNGSVDDEILTALEGLKKA